MVANRSTRCRGLALLLCFAPLWAAPDALRPQTKESASGIPFTAGDVATPDSHVFVVSWRAPAAGHVRVYAGTEMASSGRDHLVGEGAGIGQVTVSNLPPAPRWYFRLVPDRGEPLVIADRSLHLTTAANFRDAGGYRTQDGKWVRMGLAYRSNGIEHLTDDELTEIGRLDIKLVCDLRTVEEIHRNPDRVPPGVSDIPADVLADDAELIHSAMAGGANPPSMGRIYRDFVRLPSARKAYQLLFERLAHPDALPTVFHCTAGKDRSGWAEAVFLTILGVPRSTIVQDYLLTNEYLRGDALKSVRQSSRSASSQLVADPADLDAAFDQVMEDYGSFGNYLSQGLHLSDATLAAIRKNFLAG